MNNEKGFTSNNYDKMKCIWMASQVIEYKLCNNHFDCENCLFDKVMRNLLNEKETQVTGIINIVSTISSKLLNLKYDDSIIYLKNNLIAKEICPNTYYLGINPILNCFLDSVSTLIVNEKGKNINTGEQIVQIFGAWGTVSLSAPMNIVIYDKVADPVDNPLKSRLFALVGAVEKEISSGKLNKEEWDKMYERGIDIIDEINLHEPILGETMMDGGTKIKFLYQLVGNKKYMNILKLLSA